MPYLRRRTAAPFLRHSVTVGSGVLGVRDRGAALGHPHAVLEETVVKPQGFIEGVHLAVVKHPDPVGQLGDVDA